MDLYSYAFQVADKNSNGFLSINELQFAAIIVLGFNLSPRFISEFVASDTCDLTTFISLCKAALNKLEVSESTIDSRLKFSCLDESTNGFLTFQDFSRIVRRFCFIPNFKLRQFFAAVDTDDDGYVTFKDLATIII